MPFSKVLSFIVSFQYVDLSKEVVCLTGPDLWNSGLCQIDWLSWASVTWNSCSLVEKVSIPINVVGQLTISQSVTWEDLMVWSGCVLNWSKSKTGQCWSNMNQDFVSALLQQSHILSAHFHTSPFIRTTTEATPALLHHLTLLLTSVWWGVPHQHWCP